MIAQVMSAFLFAGSPRMTRTKSSLSMVMIIPIEVVVVAAAVAAVAAVCRMKLNGPTVP